MEMNAWKIAILAQIGCKVQQVGSNTFLITAANGKLKLLSRNELHAFANVTAREQIAKRRIALA